MNRNFKPERKKFESLHYLADHSAIRTGDAQHEYAFVGGLSVSEQIKNIGRRPS